MLMLLPPTTPRMANTNDWLIGFGPSLRLLDSVSTSSLTVKFVSMSLKDVAPIPERHASPLDLFPECTPSFRVKKMGNVFLSIKAFQFLLLSIYLDLFFSYFYLDEMISLYSNCSGNVLSTVFID
jgi:hypothetical protein